MKILVSTYTIQNIGGISTSLLNFINEIEQNNDVTLNVLSGFISPGITIPSDVRLVLGSKFLKYGTISRSQLKRDPFHLALSIVLRAVRRIVGNDKFADWAISGIRINECYDVAIAFSNDIYDKSGMFLIGGDYRFIENNIEATIKLAWIHNEAQKCGFTYDIAKRIFKKFDGIIHVSEDNKAIFDKIIPEYKEKSKVIYNMYNLAQINKLSKKIGNPYSQNGKLHFVTVCRLYEPQKKISRILSCCERLRKEGFSNFDWTIVGEGEDRSIYEDTAKSLGLCDIISFVGLKKNPYPYMKYADAFVLSSQYEGFGMTIKEAQILSCPTLITDFGPSHEAVIHQKQGLIGENSVNGLYTILKQVLENPELLNGFRNHLLNNPVNNDVAYLQFQKICNKKII